MKKNLKMIVAIGLLSVFTLLLTGCISIEMKVNKNGSCDLKYEIRTEGMVTLADAKQQLKSGVDEINEAAGKNVAKLKGIREKDGKIIADISISNLSYLDGGAFFGKYSDFAKEYPYDLEELWDAKSDEPVNKDNIKGAGGLNAVRISGIDTGAGDLTSFTLILPGNVKYISSNVTMVDDKTVTLGGGYGLVLYQRGGGAGWLLYVLIILVVAVVVILIAGKAKKGRSPGVSAAVPAATPVHTGAAASASSQAAADEEGEGVRYCPNCGTAQKKGAKFCSNCGGQITQ
ncbi:MAG: zinc ribbon domain-containing protein [Bacillota bacterium]|jgi:hypothetical protein|nr:zinc ribbon domain-containing protein [Bacillota bacterium]